MPEYVARYFLSAANLIGLHVEQRADGLWRIEHVPQDLRSDRLESARRAKPDPSYRKLTFGKADLDQDQHVDAVLLGPGHPLYAVVDEKANERYSLTPPRRSHTTSTSWRWRSGAAATDRATRPRSTPSWPR